MQTYADLLSTHVQMNPCSSFESEHPSLDISMNRLHAISHKAAYALAAAGLCLLLLNSLATVLDLLGRTLFSTPIDRLSDLSELTFILAAACCVPVSTAKRCHITIKPFEDRLSFRAYAIVEGLASLLLLIVWVVLAWQLWLHASQLHAARQTLSQWRNVEVAPFWYFVAAVLSFNAFLEVLNLRRLVGIALSKSEPLEIVQQQPAEAANLL